MNRSILALLLIAALAACVLAQPTGLPATTNVNTTLARFKAYYDSRPEWPRAHGFKPYKRYEWDMKQRGWPSGEIPNGALWEGFQQRQRMEHSALDEPWVNLGPYNHGGRTRVLRFHPQNPDILYAGAVSGGLWKSLDAGNSWFPLTEALPNLAVGSFEIDANNPQIMYLGTGEGYWNADAVWGIGLLKSTDGGQSWNTTGLAWPYNQSNAILQIDMDPRNSQIVFASTNSGLRRSTNGGQSFSLVLNGDVKALVRDPLHPDTMLAAPGSPWGDAQNGIYRSTDNGLSWTRMNSGIPSVNQLGRIVLAFAPSNPQIVYAGISGAFDFNGSTMIGIFRSVDNGQTWTQMSPEGDNHYAGQGWYDMALAVNPADPNTVFSSGLDLYRSLDAGAEWEQKSWWYYDYNDPDFIHADHHEIIFHPTHANEVWEVTDGGIFRSTDLGENWTEMNLSYVTYQYYAMGNATLDTALAFGGTQDNGTTRWEGAPAFDEVFGGDGGYCVVDYTNDNTIYAEWQNGHRYRSDNRGSDWVDINGGITGDGAWVTPMILDPFNHMIVYTSTQGGSGAVWKSTNRGNSWQQFGNSLGGDLQVLEMSTLVPGLLYCGTNQGVYRYDESGAWTTVRDNLPAAWVTRVVCSRFDPNALFVTLSGFGHGHVFQSLTGGGQWVNISGNLPDVPFQDVVQDLNEPSTLYAGGDVGVFRTTDGGTSWSVYGSGLPAVRVDDMDMQTSTGKLRIATHGRGMWEIATGSAGTAIFFPNGNELIAVGDTITFRWGGVSYGGNLSIEINRAYPSPDWQSVFTATPNDGAQSWTTTGPSSDHVRFRIMNLAVLGQSDTSNADTRMANPSLQLVWPNGGDTLLSGVRDTVRFTRTLVEEALRLELNRDYPNGIWETTLPVIMQESEVLWNVMLPASPHCRMRITSTTRPEIFDESDSDFVLRMPLMEMLAPVGGEQIPVGTAYSIRWSAAELAASVRITLNRNYPDGPWETVTPTTLNDGDYSWIPSGSASENARMRVAAVFDHTHTYVESPASFSIIAQAVDGRPDLPENFVLRKPFPNPFNPATRVELELPARMRVSAKVFNRLGQEVAVLADGMLDAGQHELVFDASTLPSGIYFIRVDAAHQTRILKAALVK